MRRGSRCESRVRPPRCRCTATSRLIRRGVYRGPAAPARWRTPGTSCAKAVAGVVDVVQIPRGVAVVAEDMWSAKKGREALHVTWDESGAEKRGTEQLMKEYKRLGRQSEAVSVAKVGDAEAGLKRAAKL